MHEEARSGTITARVVERVLDLRSRSGAGELEPAADGRPYDLFHTWSRRDDPSVVTYSTALDIVSAYASFASAFPEVEPLLVELDRLEEETAPEGPPFSTVTPSTFQLWSLCDFVSERSGDSLGGIARALLDVTGAPRELLRAVDALLASHFAPWCVTGSDGDAFVLQEAKHGVEGHVSAVFAGYWQPQPGEVLFARILPPLAGAAPRAVCLDTAYRAEFDSDVWLRLGGRGAARRALLKRGPDGGNPEFWLRYLRGAGDASDPFSLVLREPPLVCEAVPSLALH